MPIWAWIVVIFVGMTAAYWAGYALGIARADRAPSPAAWLQWRKQDAECRKAIAVKSLELEHEWEMEALKRGIYDQVPFDESDDEHYLPGEEEDDGT